VSVMVVAARSAPGANRSNAKPSRTERQAVARDVAPVSNRLTCAAWEAAQGIDRAQREQGPEGRASGRERANRRLPVGRVLNRQSPSSVRGVCGLEIRETADWKSALRAGAVAQIGNLLFRRLAVGRAGRGSRGWRIANPRHSRLPACATVAQVSNRLTCAAWEAAQGIDRAQREQGPEGRASGRERANRRLPVGRVLNRQSPSSVRGVCGLEIRETADWKSALRNGSVARLNWVFIGRFRLQVSGCRFLAQGMLYL